MAGPMDWASCCTPTRWRAAHGKYRQGEKAGLSARGDAVESSAQRTAVVDAVLAIADGISSSAAQVSLACCVIGFAGPDALIPIAVLAHLPTGGILAVSRTRARDTQLSTFG